MRVRVKHALGTAFPTQPPFAFKSPVSPKRNDTFYAKPPVVTPMCTLERRGRIFLVTLTGDDEHRLNPERIDSLQSALRQVRQESTDGSVLITTGEGKFFSNGFDLAWAGAAGSGSLERLQTMDKGLRQLVADLISLPMPTIAAVSGHAAAAGCMLAMSHDYILMRRDRGVLYMSELDIRMTLPDYFMAMMRTKIGSPMAQREMLLKAAKVKAEEAVKIGIIDSAHDNAAETVVAAVRLGEQLSRRKWDGEVYAEIRKASFPELCGVLGLLHRSIFRPRL